MKEPIIVYGIDITESVKQQFASGAVAVKIYGRKYDSSIPHSVIATIDKDGNVTEVPATPGGAEA